jgi:hypothetical protein
MRIRTLWKKSEKREPAKRDIPGSQKGQKRKRQLPGEESGESRESIRGNDIVEEPGFFEESWVVRK